MLWLEYDEFPSPIGRLLFAAAGEGLCALDFEGCEARMRMLLRRRHGEVRLRRGADPLGMKRRLRDYFDGDFRAFDAVPARSGGTAFQESVWTALRSIPAGQTWSYARVAAHLRRPAAARAVGQASASNPIAILVPCHRVVGTSSALTGYAGGLERKQWLLRHERASASEAAVE